MTVFILRIEPRVAYSGYCDGDWCVQGKSLQCLSNACECPTPSNWLNTDFFHISFLIYKCIIKY